MPKPLISVIIPHLNQEDHLQRCLTSLGVQREERAGEGALFPIEIIVVDNGSTRLPDQIISQFKDTQLLQEPTPGPGPARNRGVVAAKGELLAFIDADCLAHEDWLRVIARTFEDDPEVTVFGGDVRIALVDQAKPTDIEAYESVFAYRQQEYIQKQGFSGTGNLAMRRETYDKVGTFAGIEIAEDRDWGHRATALGIKIQYISGMIVYHPARASFGDLVTKWDRHISHDYDQYAGSIRGKLRWLVLIPALAVSPLWEFFRIAKSHRINTFRERCLAGIVVTKIRIYRSVRMVTLLFKGKDSPASARWNRDSE